MIAFPKGPVTVSYGGVVLSQGTTMTAADVTDCAGSDGPYGSAESDWGPDDVVLIYGDSTAVPPLGILHAEDALQDKQVEPFEPPRVLWPEILYPVAVRSVVSRPRPVPQYLARPPPANWWSRNPDNCGDVREN